MALGALLAMSVTTGAWGQWKWRDKNGQVQYSDLPPPSTVTDKQILQRPAASMRAPAPSPQAAQAASAAASAAKGVEPELEAKRRKTEEEEAAKRKAEEEKHQAAKAENCSRAKTALRTLEDGMRMARVNAQGEREILDDKARAEESKRMRDVIASDCK